MNANTRFNFALLRKLLQETKKTEGSDHEQTRTNAIIWGNYVTVALKGLTEDESLVKTWKELAPASILIPDKVSPEFHRIFMKRVDMAVAWLEAFIDEYRPTSEAETKANPEPSVQSKLAKPVAQEKRIFIGHGRSPVWRELKDLLADRLHLKWEEFNRDPAAGMATTERISQLLEAASFAFIIMTAEDKHEDGTAHARENVVHEAGLFQGRLGFRKAIILIEEGCEEFSNIKGLTQIRFPKGDILARSEEVRRVLHREDVL